MKYACIFNPLAGRNRSPRKQKTIRDELTRSGIDYEFFVTKERGHARELARHAADTGFDAVVAIGGDGTVQETATGIISSNRPAHLGVIPAGTGNDFVTALKLPKRVEEAIRLLPVAHPRRIDYGVIQYDAPEGTGRSIFINAVGIGFDARVAKEAVKFKRLPGLAAYITAVFRVLNQWSAPYVQISNGKAEEKDSFLYEGNFFLATTGNGISSGGGFLLTPFADPSDGQFDLCVVESVSTFRVLQLIPRVIKGRHLTAPEVHSYRANSLKITSESDLPVHADGEVLTESARTVKIEIVTGGLSVLTAPSPFEMD